MPVIAACTEPLVKHLVTHSGLVPSIGGSFLVSVLLGALIMGCVQSMEPMQKSGAPVSVHNMVLCFQCYYKILYLRHVYLFHYGFINCLGFYVHTRTYM